MLRYLCLLVAASVFACVSQPTKPIVRFDIEYRLTENTYDADGNITVYDSRIKATYHYVIELGLARKGVGPLQRIEYIIAASNDPRVFDSVPTNHPIDIVITVSDGFIRIADPGRTLLDHAKEMETLDPSLSDEEPVPLLTLHFGNWTYQ